MPEKNNEVTHRWPQILPGGKAVLFTVHSSGFGLRQRLDRGSRPRIERAARRSSWRDVREVRRIRPPDLHEPGYAVRDAVRSGFVSANRLSRLPWSRASGSSAEGGAYYDVSRNGVLVFSAGRCRWRHSVEGAVGRSRQGGRVEAADRRGARLRQSRDSLPRANGLASRSRAKVTPTSGSSISSATCRRV